ncbi:hypothetical protein GCM10010357_01270 [Streptomyces luteireticuli]|uniref:Uncharacterized protein n=1 Tax=Streptomyces luteireticuli TaxID=173858 RepID=A0ABP3HYB9_9ACTN
MPLARPFTVSRALRAGCPQTPDGLISARPAFEDFARRANGVRGLPGETVKGRARGKPPYAVTSRDVNLAHAADPNTAAYNP